LTGGGAQQGGSGMEATGAGSRFAKWQMPLKTVTSRMTESCITTSGPFWHDVLNEDCFGFDIAVSEG
jgi:hypothetical protein